MIHRAWCDTSQHEVREDGADEGECCRQVQVGEATVWITVQDGRPMIGQDNPENMEPADFWNLVCAGAALVALVDGTEPRGGAAPGSPPAPTVPAQANPLERSAGLAHRGPGQEPGEGGPAAAP